jgi:hypothetical protein
LADIRRVCFGPPLWHFENQVSERLGWYVTIGAASLEEELSEQKEVGRHFDLSAEF